MGIQTREIDVGREIDKDGFLLQIRKNTTQKYNKGGMADYIKDLL